MSDASRRLVGRGSIYTVASAGPLLAGVLVTPVLTRSVDITEYGWVSVCIVVMQWSVSLLALGLPVAITRHALTEPTGGAGARGIAVVGSAAVLLTTAVAGAVTLAVESYLDQDLPFALALALVAGGAAAGTAMVQACAVAEERAWFYVELAVIVSLIAPAVGLVCVALLDVRGATAYFIGVTTINIALVAAALWRISRSGPVEPSRRDLARALRVGLPIIPHQFATNSLNGIAVFVAGAVLGHAAGGQAQIAVYLGTVALVLTSAVGYAWMPVLAATGPEQRGERLAETAVTVAWLAGVAASGIAVLSPWLLALLVPSSYDVAGMVPVTAVACMSAALAAVYLAHQQVIVLSGHTRALIVISPLAMVIGAVVSIVGAHVWGLPGVAIGLPLVYLLLWLSTGVLARRVDQLRWAERRVLLPVGCATAVCLVAAVLPSAGPAAVLVRLALALVLVVVGLDRLRLVFRASGEPAAEPGRVPS